MALKHLRSSTANKRPSPAVMAEGQLAVNTAAASTGLFFKDSTGALVKTGPVHIGTTAPNADPAEGGQAGNSVGEAWLDTTGTNALLKIWDGSVWKVVQPVAAGDVVSTSDTGTVTSTMIADGTIVDADVNASAAIAGTKISPNFGSQNVVTTGTSTAASLIPTGSSVPTNGVYLPAANSVGISTNGTGRFFISSVGNTEIISSGSIPLQVSASLPRIRSNDSDGTNLTADFYTSNGNAFIDSRNDANNGPIIFRGLGGGVASEYARFTSSGRLGLGTSSPSTVFTVNNAVNASPTEDFGGIFLSSVGATPGLNNLGSAISFSRINSTRRGAMIASVESGTSTNQQGLAFFTKSATATATDSVLERLRIDEQGRVGIGTTGPIGQTHIQSASTGLAAVNTAGDELIIENSGTTGMTILSGNASSGNIYFADSDNAQPGGIQYAHSDNHLHFRVNGSERARIDSSGRLLVGTATALTNIFIGGTSTVPRVQLLASDLGGSSLSLVRTGTTGATIFLNAGSSDTNVIAGSILGRHVYNGFDGTNYRTGAQITVEVDGTPGVNDMPGRLVFSTTAAGASSPTERMRIVSDGTVRIGKTTSASGEVNVGILQFGSNGRLGVTSDANHSWFSRTTNDGDVIRFHRGTTTEVGSISVTTTATAYNTSSDYRLKENVVPLTGAIDRLQQIPVHRFNFIADPDTVVDGFIAHEAQEVVPECVTGTKDEVDEDGNPVYQGIDQSKLVPLLTAALQEALQKIEDLEARLDAANL
jgi:hypothetical protein